MSTLHFYFYKLFNSVIETARGFQTLTVAQWYDDIVAYKNTIPMHWRENPGLTALTVLVMKGKRWTSDLMFLGRF